VVAVAAVAKAGIAMTDAAGITVAVGKSRADG
jgi:hypothetical protein